MINNFVVGTSTIQKYINIIVDIFIVEHKSFARYISKLWGERFQEIINQFQLTCGLSNMLVPLMAHTCTWRKNQVYVILMFLLIFIVLKDVSILWFSKQCVVLTNYLEHVLQYAWGYDEWGCFPKFINIWSFTIAWSAKMNILS